MNLVLILNNSFSEILYMAMAEPVFNRGLHVKYWQRCFKSLLPTGYQSNDSNRLSLAFFIVSALELLGEGTDKLPPKERSEYKKWILNCEHPNGGFCGSPNHSYSKGPCSSLVNLPDLEPASLQATFFAVLLLNCFGKVTDIDRFKTLSWLQKLQRADGSFGEMITPEGEVLGGRDMRLCLCAAALRWILRAGIAYEDKEPIDINVHALVQHICNSEAYDGGIGEISDHESHAGYTYCGIAALSYLDRLPQSISTVWTTPQRTREFRLRGLTNLDDTIRWLMLRQCGVTDTDDDDEEDSVDESEPEAPQTPEKEAITSLEALNLSDSKYFVGSNGRLNKHPDTCYSFWVGASLDMLDKTALIDVEGTRRWLLEKTQHMIGGFGKEPGYPPDIYHSYMGLAALAVLETPGLEKLDSALCISQKAKEKIEKDICEYLK